jgi:transposase
VKDPLRPAFEILKTTPGIGNVLAATIMLETGTITRFGEGHFSSYCRCVESKWISNGKDKGKCNSKNGNKYLAWVINEAAAVARCAAARRRDAFTSARRPSACPLSR